MAWCSEELVVFRPAFDGARFSSVWPEGNLVLCDGIKHRKVKGANARGRSLRAQCRHILANRIQAAFEADAFEWHRSHDGSFLHEQANEIIGNEMQRYFFLDHLRT